MICEECKIRKTCRWYQMYKTIKEYTSVFYIYKYDEYSSNNELPDKLQEIMNNYDLQKCNNFIMDNKQQYNIIDTNDKLE